MADARPVSGRVQAIDADLVDLLLHSGKSLRLSLEGTIQPTPSLTRTVEAASSITIPIWDPDYDLLRTSLAAEDWNAQIDGLWFRYTALAGSGRPWTMTLEDREVSRIREFTGPVKVYAHRGKPNEVTRAEFVKQLVEEANSHLEFICPELHVQQPVAKKEQVREANQGARDRREKGIGAAKHLTMDGAALSPAQRELAETAMRIANSRPCPVICKVAVVAALMTESSLGEASPGNVLQALEPYTKIRPAEEEVSGFLFGKPTWTGVTAVGYAKSNPQATFYEIAQAVQKSGAGESSNGASNYGKFGDEARAVVDAFEGVEGSSGSSTPEERIKPRSFEVKKGEDYWTAIQRLAKEVNWRAFVVGSRFYFLSEISLAQSMVRLAIDKDTEGIEEVEIDYHRNKPITEVKFKALAKQWKPPPGSVVTLADFGPASVGFGDAPPRKGQKIGLSNNRKASTGEGRARYIVVSIEAPLTERSDARKVTITLKKPTAPLPEPAAQTETVSKSGSAGELLKGNMPKGIADAIAECDRIDARHYPYSSPGARGTPPPASGPYDCSGVASRISYVACGEPQTTLASAELSQSFEPGEGEWLTIYAKGPDGPTGHAFIGIRTPKGWRKFGTSSSNPGGGAGWIDDSHFSASYLAEFQKRHPKGL